jgi:hypothetical protein
MLLNEQHRRAAEAIARLNAAGYLTATQIAVERKVVVSAVSRWIAVGLLSAERRIIEGEPHQLIRREEFDRFNVEEWPRIVKRVGSGNNATWSKTAQRRWKNRRNGLAGGFPQLEISDEQRAKVWALKDRGYGRRTIPDRIGVIDFVRRTPSGLEKPQRRKLTEDEVRAILGEPRTVATVIPHQIV